MKKSVLRLGLTAVLIGCLLCFGCGKNTPDTEEGPVFTGETVALAPDTLEGYTIIRPDSAGEDVVRAGIELRSGLDPVKELPLSTDWVNRGQEVPTDTLEILVGHTNRAESVTLSADLRQEDFLISRTDNRIVITGGSEAAVRDAVNFFVKTFVDAEAGQISVPAETFVYRAKYDVDSLLIDGTPIEEYTILQKGSDSAVESALLLADRLTALTGYTLEAEIEPGDGKTILFRADNTLTGICSITVEDGSVVISAEESSLHLAYLYFCRDILGLENAEGQRASAVLDITIPQTSTFDLTTIINESPYLLYVSPNGSEDGDGTAENPCGSMTAAMDLVRSLRNKILQPIEMILMDGDYYFTESLTITDESSIYTPLTIRAENPGKVRFIGGVSVDPSLLQSAADTDIADRVIDSTAADKLMMLSLDWLEFAFTEIKDPRPMELFLDGQPLTRSRWPNADEEDAYLRAEDILEITDLYQSEPVTFSYVDAMNRAELYWSEESVKDLYILSFLGYDWYNNVLKVTDMDLAERIVTTETGGNYMPQAGNRFFFFNLPEEIDAPGESYLNREENVLYFYPYSDTSSEVFLSTLNSHMLVLQGCQSLTLEGITFCYTREEPISATAVDGLNIRNCRITCTADNAMTLDGSRIVVDGCTIENTWSGGIFISGGDRQTLTSGESEIKNCVIHDINRSLETYKPGIRGKSMGLVIRNNTFYNATHQMIQLNTNDVLIAYNEFYNCVTECSDMGVIYFGRNPSEMGIEICYNYFHDNGNWYGTHGQQSVYMDDGCAGAYVHDNLFYKATTFTSAIKFHAAQFALIERNIFLEMPSALRNASWRGKSTTQRQQEWLNWAYDKQESRQHNIQDKLEEAGFYSDLWQEHYAGTIWESLYDYLNADMKARILEVYETGTEKDVLEFLESNAPLLSNRIRDNVYVNLSKEAENGEIYYGDDVISENNVKLTEADFVDYGTDHTLTEAGLAKVLEAIPEYTAFPMDKIGPGNNG